MVSCGPDTLLRRPISIHQVDDTRLALLFSVIGRGTQWLSERKSGDEVDLLGPLGNGFTLLPESQRILLVAGGMGIAPLAFLANVAIRQRVKTTLLMGASSAAHLLGLPTDEPSSINIMKTTDDGSLGLKGLVTDMLVEQCRIDQADQIFACGPVPMYQTMSQMPELINKPVQVSLEVRMGCGLGICYGCTIKTRQGLKQVCHDGPIFDLNDIFWDEVIC
jgi:dihydroorotate dehydrogenase electron transfer subunit